MILQEEFLGSSVGEVYMLALLADDLCTPVLYVLGRNTGDLVLFGRIAFCS